MVITAKTQRPRRTSESALLGNVPSGAGEHKWNSDDGPDNEDHLCPLTAKIPLVHDDSLLEVAVLAYEARIGDADDLPTTYHHAMDSDDSGETGEGTSAENNFHSKTVHGSWSRRWRIQDQLM